MSLDQGNFTQVLFSLCRWLAQLEVDLLPKLICDQHPRHRHFSDLNQPLKVIYARDGNLLSKMLQLGLKELEFVSILLIDAPASLDQFDCFLSL